MESVALYCLCPSYNTHPGSSRSGDPAGRAGGQGPAWEGTAPLGVEGGSAPPGMRQSNGVKPAGLGQREWGAGWGLSPPQHRCGALPLLRTTPLTSTPEGVSRTKMGWGRQISGLGISLPPGKGSLGSSQSHLHRGEQLCPSLTRPGPHSTPQLRGVPTGPLKVPLAQTPSDGKVGGWYGPQAPAPLSSPVRVTT